MNNLKIISNPKVELVFNNYPPPFREKLLYLRELVLETAASIPEITELEETLKWGEPSYLVKKGSTIRMDWKAKKPDQYALYFKCTSQLVDTFRHVYGDTFNYETTRAIVFRLEDNIPATELKHCLSLALSYHRVKHLPFLGT